MQVILFRKIESTIYTTKYDIFLSVKIKFIYSFFNLTHIGDSRSLQLAEQERWVQSSNHGSPRAQRDKLWSFQAGRHPLKAVTSQQ